MAQLWTFLTSGNSLLFTKQPLRWGLLIKKCICLQFSFSPRENMKLSSCFWNMELMPQRRIETGTRLSTWSRWLLSRSFPSKVTFISLMPFESVLPLNWFIIDDVFWPYSDSFREPSFCFIWLDLDGWMAFNPLHDPKHLSMKGSSPAFFLAECLGLQKS